MSEEYGYNPKLPRYILSQFRNDEKIRDGQTFNDFLLWLEYDKLQNRSK